MLFSWQEWMIVQCLQTVSQEIAVSLVLTPHIKLVLDCKQIQAALKIKFSTEVLFKWLPIFTSQSDRNFSLERILNGYLSCGSSLNVFAQSRIMPANFSAATW